MINYFSRFLRLHLVTGLLARMIAVLCGTALWAQDSQADTTPTSIQVPNTGAVILEKSTNINVKPALWVVKDADTTLYLFGTVHILKPNLDWFDEAVKTSFDASDTLVMEIITPEQAESQKIFMELGLDKSGKTLRSKMSDADRAKYDAAMEKIGVPVTAFDPFEPWAAAVTMQLLAVTKEGFDANSGVETVLRSAALASKKPLIGLETMQSQLEIFDHISQDTQIKFLIESAKEIDNMQAGLSELVDSWARPDPEKLATLMNEGLNDPEIYAKLLTNRNANWARWIKSRMDKPGTIFVAVGAGHLSGTTSVPALLSAYGIDAQRVRY